MSNAQQLDQDDVLGGDELSPSAFGGTDEPAKKKSTWLPLAGGIAAGVLIIGFFGWKIASPYFARHQDRESMQALPPIGQQQDDRVQPAAQPQQPPAQSQAVPNSEPSPQSPNAGLPAQQSPSVAAQGGAGQFVTPAQTQDSGSQASVGMVNQVAVVASSPAAGSAQVAERQGVAPGPVAPMSGNTATGGSAAPAPGGTSPDLVVVNNRLEALEKSVAAIKEAVEKLSAGRADQSTSIDKESTHKSEHKSVGKERAAKKPPAHEKAASQNKKPAAADDGESKQIARGDVHLKAVLDGRAWFQTKGGESITVAPGDEVRGVGTVKSIDAERGQVLFSNGTVIR